ncbi:DUF669 domain-containing protein [Roseicella aquatilis]|uniref:DUF669 domain-containing protein n=1 Tax=Roseicella aquatilis TaxID=2527868 RepID=A0A4R4DPY1_9PROT|nr:DUF669 domain-containing protein [Roseicella aquatilis]TCZ63911.1 DUF669 domain-containing protein [Roseicella aquatilis]
MAQLNQTFDASGVAPAAPLELLPPGRYAAQIVQSEMRATRAGNGQYLWLEMDVIEGSHQGRKIWDQINLVNPNQQTVEIAQRTLSAICHAVGQLQVSDSEQLHFHPLQVTLAVEPDSRDKHLPPQEQRKQNKVKGYAPLGGAATARPAAAPPAAAARPAAPPPRPAPTASATPPWRRAG